MADYVVVTDRSNYVVNVYDDGGTVQVIDSPIQVLECLDEAIVVVRDCVGVQGQQGPPGVAGGTITVLAGETISQYQVVRILADGKGYLADRNNTTHGVYVAGVSTISALAGEPVTVCTDGLLPTSVSWTLGPLFVGDTGALISTPPPGTMSDYQLQVAVAVTTTELLVRPQTPIYNL